MLRSRVAFFALPLALPHCASTATSDGGVDVPPDARGFGFVLAATAQTTDAGASSRITATFSRGADPRTAGCPEVGRSGGCRLLDCGEIPDAGDPAPLQAGTITITGGRIDASVELQPQAVGYTSHTSPT
jgi:hypothetical protein